jgi:hypothetical protein
MAGSMMESLKRGNMARLMVGLKRGLKRTELEQTVLERAMLENASRGIHPLLRQVQLLECNNFQEQVLPLDERAL